LPAIESLLHLSIWRPTAAIGLGRAFQPPGVLTEAEVIEAEAELRALQRHALELVATKPSS